MTDLPFAPPQNLAAEDRVLGTLVSFYAPALVRTVKDAGLTWQDFYRETNRVVYRAILHMHGAGEHVDTLTLTRFLECQRYEDTNWLAVIGGPARVEYLAGFGTLNGLREAAAIVHEDGELRTVRGLFLEGLDAVTARDWGTLDRVIGRLPRREITKPGLTAIEGGKAA